MKCKLRYALIKQADWIDAFILRHHFYWVCQKVGLSSWWDADDVTSTTAAAFIAEVWSSEGKSNEPNRS